MISSRVRAVFASAVASALAAAAGCGGTTLADPTGTSADGGATPNDGASAADAGPDFSGLPCGRVTTFQSLAKTTVAQPFDYLELREGRSSGAKPDPTPEPPHGRLLGSIGTACETATDRAACTAALEKTESLRDLFPDIGPGLFTTPTFIVFQRGDEVRVVDTKPDLLALLGPIDSAEEARLVVESEGYTALCSEGSATRTATGYTVLATRIRPNQSCLNKRNGHVLAVATSGTITEQQTVDLSTAEKVCSVAGRRPEGYRPRANDGESDVVAYLATMHDLEAASVPAFLRLADELEAHDAPTALRERAREAARDEVRHAAGFAWLRRLYDTPNDRADSVTMPCHVRSLEEIAIENAVEGCVRETFGALVAGYQAEAARDPNVRRLFATIADDETRHAELAWDVAAWLDTRLDEPARVRVRAARDQASAELARELRAATPSADLVARCGLPTTVAADVLVAECSALWAA